MDENGLYTMLAQVFRLAIRDALKTQNPAFSVEAAGWLWDIAPYVAAKADIPIPEGEA